MVAELNSGTAVMVVRALLCDAVKGGRASARLPVWGARARGGLLAPRRLGQRPTLLLLKFMAHVMRGPDQLPYACYRAGNSVTTLLVSSTLHYTTYTTQTTLLLHHSHTLGGRGSGHRPLSPLYSKHCTCCRSPSPRLHAP